MAKFVFPMIESDVYPFRRWLKARDQRATIDFAPAAADDHWIVSVTTTKAYIARLSVRRWRAARSLES